MNYIELFNNRNIKQIALNQQIIDRLPARDRRAGAPAQVRANAVEQQRPYYCDITVAAPREMQRP